VSVPFDVYWLVQRQTGVRIKARLFDCLVNAVAPVGVSSYDIRLCLWAEVSIFERNLVERKDLETGGQQIPTGRAVNARVLGL